MFNTQTKCPCPCKQPGWCEEYRKNLVGRLWELCCLSTPLGDKYRRLWGMPAPPPVMTSSSNGKTDSTKAAPPSPCGCAKGGTPPTLNRSALPARLS